VSDNDFTYDQNNPLDRCRGETRRANDALRDYWLLGPGRSQAKLQQSYSKATSEMPPTRHLRTIAGWSSKYQWQARIDDAKQILDDEIAKAEVDAYRERVLGSGYALYYKRVASLQGVADLLHQELHEKDKRWLPDVKQIGSGEDAERVDIVRFNAQLIEQFRRTLDDIAAELGERVKRQEVSGPDGGPIAIFDVEEWKDKRASRLNQIDQLPEPNEGTGDETQNA
jgi:hypothetical protein